jgi:carboxylate-amine ligase
VDHEQRAAGQQAGGSLLAQPVEHGAPVEAGVDVARAAAFGQAIARRGNVRGIGHDEVEAMAVYRLEQVAQAGAHAHVVEARVQPRRRDRPAGAVHGGHLAGTGARGGYRQRAAARAHVDHARAAPQIALERPCEQPRVAERTEHARRDEESHGPEVPRRREGETVSAPDAGRLHRAFEAPAPLTVGLEDEAMLLDPQTLELAPVAGELLARLGEANGAGRFKAELPRAHLEVVTPPRDRVGEAVADLAAGRRALAHAAEGLARPASAAVHPFSSGIGEVNEHGRYGHVAREYGPVARCQLVCALQVHVALGDPGRTLAVYNALRSYLPELAALAANGPWYEGVDMEMASVRPKLCELLPRQGVPPAIGSWEAFAAELAWGERAGAVREGKGGWWWELRPHPLHGTIEVRVPDAQTTLAEAGAVAAVVHCLVAWLGARHDGGDLGGPAPTWRIEENRWSACRHGVEGEMADLSTGERRPTRERLHALLERLAPVAERLDCAAELDAARGLVERNGAMRQREVAGRDGARALAEWLCARFLDDAAG